MRPKALAGPQEAQGTKLFAENPPAFIRGAGPDLSLRHPGEKRAVVAGFDGGRMTSDAGALLRGATDRAIGLVERFAVCFTDDRTAELIEHEVRTLIGQRVLAIVLGYEGLVDHDQLRHDPTLAMLADRLAARCAAGRQVETQPVEVGWARDNGLPAAVATARKAGCRRERAGIWTAF